MKSIILTLTFCLALFFAFGQKPSTLFYSENWELCEPNSAMYVRQCMIDTKNLQFKGQILDLYSDGSTFMEGKYLNGAKNGTFKFYHKNGQISKQGKYKNNLRDSLWTYYDEMCNVQSEILFENDNFSVLEYKSDKGTIIDGTGQWYNSSTHPTTGYSLNTTGSFQNGLKHGWWEIRDHHNKLVFREKFKNGKFITGKFYSNDGTVYNNYTKEIYKKLPDDPKFIAIEYFIILDSTLIEHYTFLKNNKIAPVPQNIDQEENSERTAFLFQLIRDNLIYPDDARKDNIEGKVFVSFKVNELGQAYSFGIAKGINSSCDKAALNVVQDALGFLTFADLMPLFPLNGKNVLPIQFKLNQPSPGFENSSNFGPK
jgi:TonB family protein